MGLGHGPRLFGAGGCGWHRWPLPEGWSEEELEAKLFWNQPVPIQAARQRPQRTGTAFMSNSNSIAI